MHLITAIGTFVPRNIFENVADAMQSEFDDIKLDDYYDCEIVCDSSTARFKDRLSTDCGYRTYKKEINYNGCITDLMVYVKYHVERHFRKSIDLLNEACPAKKRSHLTKTGKCREITFFFKMLKFYCDFTDAFCINAIGFGWLTINIFGAATDGHAQICDFWSPCDLYVRVLADNKEICRTDVQRDRMSVDIFKTCISNKIRKTATIKFELWDKDVSDNDCLDRWQRNVDMEPENLRYGHSVVGVNAVWNDEYREDWA